VRSNGIEQHCYGSRNRAVIASPVQLCDQIESIYDFASHWDELATIDRIHRMQPTTLQFTIRSDILAERQ
jgi:hypothetical protein